MSKGLIYGFRIPVVVNLKPIYTEKNIDELTYFPKEFYVLKIGRSKNINTLANRFNNHVKNWLKQDVELSLPRNVASIKALTHSADLCFIVNITDKDCVIQEDINDVDRVNIDEKIVNDLEADLAHAVGTKTHSLLFGKVFGKMINFTEYYIVDKIRYDLLRNLSFEYMKINEDPIPLINFMKELNSNMYTAFCDVAIRNYKSRHHVKYCMISRKESLITKKTLPSISINIENTNINSDAKTKVFINGNRIPPVEKVDYISRLSQKDRKNTSISRILDEDALNNRYEIRITNNNKTLIKHEDPIDIIISGEEEEEKNISKNRPKTQKYHKLIDDKKKSATNRNRIISTKAVHNPNRRVVETYSKEYNIDEEAYVMKKWERRNSDDYKNELLSENISRQEKHIKNSFSFSHEVYVYTFILFALIIFFFNANQ